MLEVKAFDNTKSANFDVANFDSYIRALTTDSYKIDSDYLIFSYELQDGKLKVKKLWIKKVWEICSASELYPIKSQVKQKKIVNIRPGTWESARSKFKVFKTKRDFVNALNETVQKYENLSKSIDRKNWLKIVTDNYYQHTGKRLLD